jgi:hypothetical protein
MSMVLMEEGSISMFATQLTPPPELQRAVKESRVNFLIETLKVSNNNNHNVFLTP